MIGLLLIGFTGGALIVIGLPALVGCLMLETCRERGLRSREVRRLASRNASANNLEQPVWTPRYAFELDRSPSSV